eukprot:TRINITY_DN17068_c0_g1_i1.p1 TRINITY_DN17068_c0_g1~~TRINITY_DN17068_c0_g1_i1.p1  ORF type:complete len:333 (+),score=27.21 TRINITY_DN17068_c0_g1_i1:153-1151(+)
MVDYILRPLGTSEPAIEEERRPPAAAALAALVAARLQSTTGLKEGQLFNVDATPMPDAVDAAVATKVLCFVVTAGEVQSKASPSGGEELQPLPGLAVGYSLLWEPLPQLKRIHILPFQEPPLPDGCSIYDDFLRPYLLENAGPLYTGYEFSYQHARFRVVATDPHVLAGSGVFAARDTEVFSQGPPFARPALDFIMLLPYLQESSNAADLIFTADEGASEARERIIRRHFEQQTTIAKNDEFTTVEGVRFRVSACQPEFGSIFPTTQIRCAGPPLVGCAFCGALAVRRCQVTECSKLLCSSHMLHSKLPDGSKEIRCQEHAHADTPPDCAIM